MDNRQNINGLDFMKIRTVTKYILQGGSGGASTVDSHITFPCTLDRNALRNPPQRLLHQCYG